MFTLVSVVAINHSSLLSFLGLFRAVVVKRDYQTSECLTNQNCMQNMHMQGAMSVEENYVMLFSFTKKQEF